jgi:hypothetical protein
MVRNRGGGGWTPVCDGSGPPRAAIGFGAAAPAAASVGFAAAPPGALATGSGGGAGTVSAQDFNFTQATPAMSDDPYTFFDAGSQSAVLCATAIEYGLIAAF